MSYILAKREKEPFSLLLLDNHPDNQEPEFGGVLSCGGWVKTLQERCPMLQEVLTIGPELREYPDGWARGKRVYVSLDKDIMSKDYARTDWSQGEFTLEGIEGILRKVEGNIIAVDICGELSVSKGATPEDLRINKLTNIQLLELMSEIISTDLKRTCLYGEHVALGAKISPFAGYEMPIQYSNIVQEHLAVRQKVGMFDVSHMGEVFVEGPEAEKFVNWIFTNEIRGFEPGKVLYGMMCYPDGGTVDDLLVYREFQPDHFLLVINAANIDKDVAWIQEQAKGFDCTVRNESPVWGQIAVQGPEAEKTVIEVLGMKEAADLTFYTFCDLEYKGSRLILSRTGYTGEDGFELYTTLDNTVELWKRLLAAGVEPCGLGCRDTLRFEAGLPLYGDELSADISPVMAGLGMFCKFDKDFIGKEALLDQKAGNIVRKLVGIEIEDKAIPRAGYPVELEDGTEVGIVTTGYHSISLDKSICFALVNKEFAALDTPLWIRIRKKVFPGKVVKKRFYQTNYKK
jgi:aminomethyltransferase